MRSKAHWGYDADFMLRCRDELTLAPDEIDAQPTFALEEDGRLLGFYMLRPIESDRMELSYLFVEPHAIGHGHGRVLIEHAKRYARAQGARLVEIQGDPHAVGFYLAAGARLVGGRASASIPGRLLPLFEIRLQDKA